MTNIYVTITPQLVAVNTSGSSTSYLTAWYLSVYDAATGQLTPGNGVPATYQYVLNGVPGEVHTTSIAGTQQYFAERVSQVFDNASGAITQSFDIVLLSYDTGKPDTGAPNYTVCDAEISDVTVDKKESAFGAADAQVTILARSSQLPLTYSLDGKSFQASPVFSGLHGGAYTAYVSDAGGCTATARFTIDTVQNLLTGDPSVDLGSGNTSRWNAAFNPVVFTYQRKDFEVTVINADGNGNTLISVNANLSSVIPGDLIYVCAGAYRGVYAVSAVTGGQLTIRSPYTAAGNQSGFVNINRLRPYYQVKTQITYFDKKLAGLKSITSTNRPDETGLVRADISSFLQSLLQPQDESDFTQLNFRDDNLSASYTIAYAEVWDGQTIPPAYVNLPNPFYVVYAAKQLGDAYGGNLAAYVTFPTVNSQSLRAKWLTDFTEPVYAIGFPFDIGFIYSESLAGRDIYCELTVLDINRRPIAGGTQISALLNEDHSFLLNQDGGKLVIANGGPGGTQLAQHIGLNRLLINQNFPAGAYYFTLTLKYDEGETTHTITQTQIIRIDGILDDQSVYLRWIGLTGSWNYYRFVYNQEVSLDVQNAVIVKNYVSNWASQNSIEEVISKTAGIKIKVLAEDLSVADVKGLQSIKYSPKVQLLVNKNPIKWQTVIINTATFAEYETRNSQAPFSVTFNLPSVNVQTQ